LAGTPATNRRERPLSGSFLISCGRRQFCKLLQPSLRPFPERVPPRAPPSRRSKTCLAGARFVLRSAPTACSVSSPGSPVARGAAPSTERIPALLPRGDHGAGHDCRLREARSLSGQRSPGMAKCKSLPPHAVHVRTFAELEQYVGAFAEGHLNLLMIFGQPGVGKSPCVRQALGRKVCWISGQATPFGIYLQAYEHRHQPIVLDDVDGLYADRQGIRVLKALGQTEGTKTLSWQSAAPTLERHDIPRQFTTTSRVALVGNDWKTLNADVAALEDRGHLLLFEPAPLEVHRQAARWFWDQEIFDFVADHLHLIGQHSLRTYRHAFELKQAGLDWRQGVLCRCLTGAALEWPRPKANPALPSDAGRVRVFVQSGAGCRASYFRHAKKLRPLVDKPKIKLTQPGPPADTVPPSNHLDRLRRRFGRLGNG